MEKSRYVYIIIKNGISESDFRNLCPIVGIYGNYIFRNGVFKAWIYSDERISKLTNILTILGCSYDVAYSKEKEESLWG